MTESQAIVGMLAPGVVVMFAIGALISADAIAVLPAMLWAVAGDGLSFWLGRRFQDAPLCPLRRGLFEAAGPQPPPVSVSTARAVPSGPPPPATASLWHIPCLNNIPRHAACGMKPLHRRTGVENQWLM